MQVPGASSAPRLAEVLAQLRDIHVPPPPGPWPPAPLWWLLAGLLAAFAAWLAARLHARAQRQAPLVETARLLDAAYARYAEAAAAGRRRVAGPQFANEVAALLRRLSLATRPSGDVDADYRAVLAAARGAAVRELAHAAAARGAAVRELALAAAGEVLDSQAEVLDSQAGVAATPDRSSDDRIPDSHDPIPDDSHIPDSQAVGQAGFQAGFQTARAQVTDSQGEVACGGEILDSQAGVAARTRDDGIPDRIPARIPDSQAAAADLEVVDSQVAGVMEAGVMDGQTVVAGAGVAGRHDVARGGAATGRDERGAADRVADSQIPDSQAAGQIAGDEFMDSQVGVPGAGLVGHDGAGRARAATGRGQRVSADGSVDAGGDGTDGALPDVHGAPAAPARGACDVAGALLRARFQAEADIDGTQLHAAVHAHLRALRRSRR